MSRWVWTGVVKSKVALNYALRPTECPVWSRPKSHIHHPQKTKKRPEIRLPSGTQRDARRLVHPTGVMGQYGISRWSRIGAPIDYFMNGKPPLLVGAVFHTKYKKNRRPIGKNPKQVPGTPARRATRRCARPNGTMRKTRFLGSQPRQGPIWCWTL